MPSVKVAEGTPASRDPSDGADDGPLATEFATPGPPVGRRDRARLTRARIIRAAHAEFVENGYHGTTVGAIARRAGVAPQTVYFIFHTKPELISAVIDAAVRTDDGTHPDETGWWSAMVGASSAREALELFVGGVGPLYARAAGVSEVLRAAATTDDELRMLWKHHDDMQVEGFRRVIDLVVAKGGLRPGLEPDRATDLLLTIFGDTTYVLLTAERGWSDSDVVAWMTDALPRLLLEP